LVRELLPQRVDQSPNRRSRGAHLNRSGSQETAVYDLPLAVITE